MAQYYTLVTDTGTKKIAEMIATGSKLNLVKIQLGDGGGSYYEPSTKQTALKNKLHEINVNNIKTNAENPNWITIEGIVEAKVGGFYIREVGIFDDSNQLIAIAKYSETYKPLPSEGTAKELVIRVVIDIDNVDSINMSVNADISVATKDDIKELETKIDNIKVNNNFPTATGTGTEITIDIDMDKIQNGDSFTFIASANNGGSATTVNGKPLYKPNTTTPPNIKDKNAYTIWYNAPGDCFFLKASAEGNAVSENVLADKTFSNDDDTGLIGTMPNNGVINEALNAGQSKVLPKGYIEGGKITANSLASQTQATAGAGDILSGKTAWVNGNKITGNIPSYGALNASKQGWTGSYLWTQFPQGYYINGAGDWSGGESRIQASTLQNILGITANKIVSGQQIAGVWGSATIESLGGIRMTSGSITLSTNEKYRLINVGFTPNLVFTNHDNKLSVAVNNLFGFSLQITDIRDLGYKPGVSVATIPTTLPTSHTKATGFPCGENSIYVSMGASGSYNVSYWAFKV